MTGKRMLGVAREAMLKGIDTKSEEKSLQGYGLIVLVVVSFTKSPSAPIVRIFIT
jgi:hypothetical protein